MELIASHPLAGSARETRPALHQPAVAGELGDILARHKFARKIDTSLLSVDQLVEGYASLTAVVRPVAIPRIVPDPNDDLVIGTALAAKPRAIVTRDKPLLLAVFRTRPAGCQVGTSEVAELGHRRSARSLLSSARLRDVSCFGLTAGKRTTRSARCWSLMVYTSHRSMPGVAMPHLPMLLEPADARSGRCQYLLCLRAGERAL